MSSPTTLELDFLFIFSTFKLSSPDMDYARGRRRMRLGDFRDAVRYIEGSPNSDWYFQRLLICYFGNFGPYLKESEWVYLS